MPADVSGKLIMGAVVNCYQISQKVPTIWYAQYDGVASFSDWGSFWNYGGWTKPHNKQYNGYQYQCNMGID